MSLRWKAIWVAALVGLMGWAALPSFFSPAAREASIWLADEAMNLGLDLRGGVYWLLRVDEEEALAQEMRTLSGVTQEAAEEQGVPLTATHVRPGGLLELEGDLDALEALASDTLSNVAVSRVEGRLEIRPDADRRAQTIERAVGQVVEVLRLRLDEFGVTEPLIAPHGDDRIMVQMPGGEVDPEAARDAISKVTFLEFKLVLDTDANEELLAAKHPGGLPDDTMIVVSRNPDETIQEAFLVPVEPVLMGSLLDDARLDFDRRNRARISFTWNSEGTEVFREFTGDNVGERLAAILDSEVITAPTIRGRIGRSGVIEGSFTQEEAARLAVLLRSGSLPIGIHIEEERTVGPALGQDSINNGVRSILLGGGLVIVFMLLYYRQCGLFADVTLVVNLVLIIGVMSLLGATLTLPGIAGLVLTIGMAVDANVIIFERIREELRRDQPLRSAVAIGFNRSRLTILDANVTTLIAAVVLLSFGRGPVQGFGVTLAIGIAASVFSALVVTRLLVDSALARNPNQLRI